MALNCKTQPKLFIVFKIL